tara:strand:- start:1973 stop:2551 length:579 start_codon:yes stop_codon:yes gene_type:complete
MQKNNILKIFFLFFFIIILFIFFYFKFFKKSKQITEIKPEIKEELVYSSNVINDVFYTTIDANGNEYIIRASLGEIDYNKPNIIYLTTVNALIKLNNLNEITIKSEYGKYNSDNFDTIFSKNVIVDYLENRIEGEYLDFSLNRNSMIMSKKVVYTNLDNILKADVVEMNIETKDTKIFMHEKGDQVNITNKN